MKTKQRSRSAAVLTLGAALLSAAASAAPVPFFPGLGRSGGATSHGDTLSSDTSYRRGPQGGGKLQLISLSAACPNLMVLSDGKVAAMCVDYITRKPKLTLFDQDGKKLAQTMLSSASLLGSVYAYADEKDNIVYVDANHNLNFVHIVRNGNSWALKENSFTAIHLGRAVVAHCGGGTCDSVVALNPGSSADDVWFVTQNAVVGVANRKTRKVIYTKLSNYETVANSFSTASGDRTSIATNHNLYMLAKENGKIVVKWKQKYDRGTARKPGQLSWGTGATPTFFGTNAGNDEFVTITDNAQRMNLLVYRSDNGQQVCKVPLFGSDNSGTEDSSVAIGRAIVVNSTYGYPYPKYPKGAGKSVPEKAPFVGGMTRVDVKPDGKGCVTKWTNNVRSAALPKLSTADGLLYTVERTGPSQNAGALDTYKFVTVDWNTGQKRSSVHFSFGLLSDPLQTAGNFGFDRSYWQGTMNGIIRVKP
ncbi:hypothetical protein [Conchiformibius kuhniae]|uniref:Uncharacterized protein n=1 Tax=Conchiformibius kuhniae TaxID=211502 RepID=A0ABD8B7C0_9NEIS|nr:hypothetical protein [Conchiformibius kuhniae]